MSVFVFGIFLGNRKTFGSDRRRETGSLLDFVGLRLLMRMLIFIILGEPGQFHPCGGYLGRRSLVLVFHLHPPDRSQSFVCAFPGRAGEMEPVGREIIFMCWTRERK